MGRIILAIAAGVVVSVMVVAGVDAVAHQVYPPPAGIELHDPAAMRTIISLLPPGAFAIMLCGWVVAAGLGAWLTTRLSPPGKTWPGAAVGGVTLAATGINLFAIAHPTWVVAAALVGIPVAAWLGIKLARARPSALTTARAA